MTAKRSAREAGAEATERAGGVAGHSGDEVRSDLTACVSLCDRGGVDVEIVSKVAALYGEAIARTARETLAALGVEHAAVSIDDRGALPWVIAARVEAAARRAGVRGGDARPTRSVAPVTASPRDRLRRSRLYLPGDQPKYFVNAGIHGPDGIILDLEDSVHPAEKDAARLVVRNALRCVDFREAERMVRINPLPAGVEDLEAVVPEDPDVILIPKTERAEQVVEAEERIRAIRARAGGDEEPSAIWLMPILESALGVENAFAIADASPAVVALTIGLEDYTADIGVPKTPEGRESLYARTRLVNAARAAGVQPIDSVFGDVGDEEGLRRWAVAARGLGFEGMGCIHPRQIRPIHESFAPTSDEIRKALGIVAAFRDAEERGVSVVSLGTRMIDRPVVARALRLVESARRAGLLEDAEP